ncbi:hypothetical protein TNCV_4024971 [Trichonephila clavipes]|uniref:Uncharacterized protein n=1 Tax=Trichonephila clavipes TaxID=2585209 RepID=A0A8X6WD79_TRICX|nr:hypothetical protein TNCV_4024971 [Trichonephila clavipes]
MMFRAALEAFRQWHKGTKKMAPIEKSLGSHGCSDMSQTNSEVNLVPRTKHITAFVGFTRVNNQGERNNIQGNAQTSHSRRMEHNNHLMRQLN